jgi:hypothetical protein
VSDAEISNLGRVSSIKPLRGPGGSLGNPLLEAAALTSHSAGADELSSRRQRKRAKAETSVGPGCHRHQSKAVQVGQGFGEIFASSEAEVRHQIRQTLIHELGQATSTTIGRRTSVRGLGEIALRVNNLDAMQKFYEEVTRLADARLPRPCVLDHSLPFVQIAEWRGRRAKQCTVTKR